MMETGWELGYGMEMGMEMKSPPEPLPTTAFATVTPAYMYGIPASETLRVDELLDFTNQDLFPSSSSSSSSIPADATGHLLPAQEFSSSAAAGFNASFPDDIYIPSEEAAELEWLSKFVEDSFSDMPYHYSLASEKTVLENSHFHGAEVSIAGCAARGKTSLEVSSSSSSSSSSSCSSDIPKGKTSANSRKKQTSSDGGMRRCTHCASEKTPQWRTGPLGPKTLCNACGVRFKSGRLVPEYRPAASPTFVLTQHSNSHRKVIELRRQKEFLILRHSSGATAADSSSGGGGSSTYAPELLFHDYEVY